MLFLSIEAIAHILLITFYGLIFLKIFPYILNIQLFRSNLPKNQVLSKYIPTTFIVNRCFFSFLYWFKREIKRMDNF